MKNIFTKHPRAMNETYIEHLVCASIFGFKMLIGGVACLIHAIFPFVLKNTGSNLLFAMMQEYVNRLPQVEERTNQLSQAITQKRISCHQASESMHG